MENLLWKFLRITKNGQSMLLKLKPKVCGIYKTPPLKKNTEKNQDKNNKIGETNKVFRHALFKNLFSQCR